MVAAHREASSSDCRIVIRPNASLSWHGTVWFFGGICLVSLMIASGFAWAGVWWILPFSGLELMALGAALYIVVRRNAQQEVVAINGDVVDVQCGTRAPTDQWRFARAWVQVELSRAGDAGRPSRLALRSHGREIELGARLTEPEKEYLARELRYWIGLQSTTAAA